MLKRCAPIKGSKVLGPLPSNACVLTFQENKRASDRPCQSPHEQACKSLRRRPGYSFTLRAAVSKADREGTMTTRAEFVINPEEEARPQIHSRAINLRGGLRAHTLRSEEFLCKKALWP